MAIVVDATRAHQDRKAVAVKGFANPEREEDSFFATLYMGAPPDSAAHDMGSETDDKTLPQAYLVEQPANATVVPHFHDTDQFQVFVRGEALFGKKEVGSLSVHYAGGHTPYGPIVAKDNGVHYFTLRAHWDSGGKPMPASRDKLKKVPRVHRLAEDIELGKNAAPCDELLPIEDDGLGASMFTIEAGETQTIDLPKPGSGQYAVVVSGAMKHGDQDLATNSCLYRFADEEPLTLTATEPHSSVLLLQFPLHD